MKNHNKLKITILTDAQSYTNYYNEELKNNLLKLGHAVMIIHSKEDLEKGDIVFLFSCFELISPDKLKLNKKNIVIHESDLPQGKGWSPASWQILEGKNNITLTAFEAVDEVDAGDIYLKERIELTGVELVDEWRKKIAHKKNEMALNIVSNFHDLVGLPQQGESSYYTKRTPADCELDITQTIDAQFNLLRITDNDLYPAFFIKDGVKFILHINKEQQK